MKIACVDKTAADRVELQKRFEDAYAECRQAVGHLNIAHTFPASKDEVLLNTAPDVVAVGPGFNVEASYNTCREIKTSFPEVPIILFLPQESYSLRTLKRFQDLCIDVFSPSDP